MVTSTSSSIAAPARMVDLVAVITARVSLMLEYPTRQKKAMASHQNHKGASLSTHSFC